MNTYTPPDFPDAFRLDGKTLLITGASSGIGRATAILCAQLGANLILSGRDEERLHETHASLPGEGHSILAADLTDAQARNRLADDVAPLDGVVFSAGAAELMPLRMLTEQHLRRMMEINFEAPVLLSQRLLSRKKIRPHASLVYVSARSEHLAPLASAIYSASKAALNTAVRTLAWEHAKHGIRANCVSPGYVETPMLEQLSKLGGMPNKDNAWLILLGEIQPEDVANSIAYLLCPASRWVSRSSLTIDGGLSLHAR